MYAYFVKKRQVFQSFKREKLATKSPPEHRDFVFLLNLFIKMKDLKASLNPEMQWP